MSGLIRAALVAVLLFVWGEAAPCTAAPITPEALALAHSLDRLDVSDRWQAGIHVDWRTGLPDGSPETLPGRHTHCSAFVAAAADTAGIYILRPPEHGQVLLANAQSEWLASTGPEAGWRALPNAAAAQDFSNRGYFVVASYHSRFDDRPGHIAIVLPGDKAAAIFAADGPDVMQAGTVNSTRISLREGFSGHPGAFARDRIAFYAHAVSRE